MSCTFIKDLGTRAMSRVKGTDRFRRVRFCIWECPTCNIQFEGRHDTNPKRIPNECKNCSQGRRGRTHGDTGTLLHSRWKRLKSKCYTKSNSDYQWYGAVGVTVCDEWKDSYEAFRDWSLANGYKEGLSLDKDILCDKLGIHPKVYGPTTCMYITQSENAAYTNVARSQ